MATIGAFCWYELRTTAPNAAGAFYAGVAGWEVEPSEQSSVFRVGKRRVGGLMELPERARVRGAPAHWLGHIWVLDVDASVERMVGLGAQVLGPVQQAADGRKLAILRDPQGTVVALSSPGDGCSREGIAWHELHTTDHERAWSTYAELFGWQATETRDLGPEIGPYQVFSWASGDQSVGGMVSSARAPHIHTHWLFYLTVADLDGSLEKVRSLGGAVSNGPAPVQGGHRIAYCEDPQGAAFGLYQYVKC
jgi:uncharacterized protein